MPNLKLTLVILELLAFNAQNSMGLHDPGHAPFSKKFFRGHIGTFPGSTYANLKFGSLTILELLAFNAQKVTGSRDPGRAPFSKKIFKGHVGTFPGSKHAKFEVRTFSHFGAINI